MQQQNVKSATTAGLARKGYAVAQPMNQNYGYPQSNQPYGQQPNYN